MKRFVLITILCLVNVAFGYEGKVITGKIYGMNGEPLVGASVTVKPANGRLRGVASDANGEYYLPISTIHCDSITLKVSAIGYRDQILRTFPKRDTTKANFSLVEKPIDYGTVVVSPPPQKGELITTMNSEQINFASRHSLFTTNPTSAIRQAQVVREGSNHSSKVRVNGTNPIYDLNGAEMGYDPNHFGMFSIVPGSIVEQIKFFPRGTGADHGSPSVIEFVTSQPYESRLHSELDLSFIEGTGSIKVGSRRFYLLSSVRKSVLDKLADKITSGSKQRSIPPTNFRDIFFSGGFRASRHFSFLLDHYDVNDYLSYNLGPTSNNPGGISTLQNTGESFWGTRLEGISKHLSLKLGGAVKESRELYQAIAFGGGSLNAFHVELSSKSRTDLADLDVNLLFGKTQIAGGGNFKYLENREIDLHQINWNFMPPDANSDNPYIYQRELNRYYGSYESTANQTSGAGYFSVKQALGKIEIESGVRREYFGDLRQQSGLLLRNSLIYKSDKSALGISLGTYANSPTARILEPYQVLVQANLRRLRPIETNLAAINWEIGPVKLGAFKKDIMYLPRITPDFSQVDMTGQVGPDFLVMSPDGRISSYGADITLELNNFHRWDMYTYYGYTRAEKVTKDITVPYELNAPHKFYGQTSYKFGKHFKAGASLSVRTGFPHTQIYEPGSIQSVNTYTIGYYRHAISSENSTRFPINITSDLFMDISVGQCQVYLTITNISNHRNPIICTADGFIYDAGILPSLGLKYKF